MAELYFSEETPQRIYWDRKYYTSFEDQVDALHGSSTLYVGNLSFYTTELQIYETFSRVGPIKRIIMGLNRETKTPCGFCFVEYFTHEHARECLKFINGTMCDDRIIRCELDGGFKQGRQFGRGASGGQIRDERRTDIDLGRGGVVQKSFLGKRNVAVREYDQHDRTDRSERYDRNDRHSRSDRNNDREFQRERRRTTDIDDFGRDRRRSRDEFYESSNNPQSDELKAESTQSTGNNNSNIGEGDEHPASEDIRYERNSDEDEDSRPRKNPRFREENDGNEHEED